MKPGRELDELIAEKVMNLKCKGGHETDDYELYKFPCPLCAPKNYSTNIGIAWEVVEKLDTNIELSTMFKQEPKAVFISMLSPSLGVTFGEPIWVEVIGETLPHAICLAALKAVGAT